MLFLSTVFWDQTHSNNECNYMPPFMTNIVIKPLQESHAALTSFQSLSVFRWNNIWKIYRDGWRFWIKAAYWEALLTSWHKINLLFTQKYDAVTQQVYKTSKRTFVINLLVTALLLQILQRLHIKFCQYIQLLAWTILGCQVAKYNLIAEPLNSWT